MMHRSVSPAKGRGAQHTGGNIGGATRGDRCGGRCDLSSFGCDRAPPKISGGVLHPSGASACAKTRFALMMRRVFGRHGLSHWQRGRRLGGFVNRILHFGTGLQIPPLVWSSFPCAARPKRKCGQGQCGRRNDVLHVFFWRSPIAMVSQSIFRPFRHRCLNTGLDVRADMGRDVGKTSDDRRRSPGKSLYLR